MRKCHHHFNLHLLILHNHGTPNPRQVTSNLGQPTEGGPGQTGAGTIWLPPFQTSKVWFGKRLAKSKKKCGRFQVFHMWFFQMCTLLPWKIKKNVMIYISCSLKKGGLKPVQQENSPVASAAQHEKEPIPRKVQIKRKHLLFDARHPKRPKVAAHVSPKTCPAPLFTCTNGWTWGGKVLWYIRRNRKSTNISSGKSEASYLNSLTFSHPIFLPLFRVTMPLPHGIQKVSFHFTCHMLHDISADNVPKKKAASEKSADGTSWYLPQFQDVLIGSWW